MCVSLGCLLLRSQLPYSVGRFNVTKITKLANDHSEIAMYLVVIAWSYVVVLMSLAEALSPQGSWLGALFTLLLYGVLPLSIVVYIIGTPSRKRALRQAQVQEPRSEGLAPDAGGHAAGAAERPGITSVGEEQRRP